MRLATLAGYPARPESEVEWEDLLLKLELMPRALRVVLEDVDRSEPAVHALLDELVRREAFAGELLDRAAGHGDTSQSAPPQTDEVERFVRLRARNFAMMQRRGIDVWEWEAELAGEGAASVYQILAALAAEDVALLAALRSSSRHGSGMC